MNSGRTYLEIIYCQWDLLTKDQLDEDLVEGEVDDTRIKHSFGNELTNDSRFLVIDSVELGLMIRIEGMMVSRASKWKCTEVSTLQSSLN